MRYFETKFLEEADEFIQRLLEKYFITLILLNKQMIRNSLRKIQSEIWEFRTKFAGLQLMAL